MALFFAPVTNVVLSRVRFEEQGRPRARTTVRELGGVLGVAVLASIFAHYGGYRTPSTFVDGMNAAVYFGAGVVVLGGVAAFLIKPLRSRGRQPVEIAPELEAAA